MSEEPVIIEVNLSCVILISWTRWDGDKYLLGCTRIENGKTTEYINGNARYC